VKLACRLLPVLAAAGLAVAPSQAGDVVIDGARWASAAEASKGQNCPSNMVQFEEASGRAVWSVASSTETAYDFGKLEVQTDGAITPRAVVILDADIALAEGSYLEVGLRLADGRYFFSNLKDSEVLSRSSFEFPVEKMASSDGQPFADETAPLAAVSLMVNSDSSDSPGSSEIRIEKLVVAP
jgi:hypothetical protein